MKIEIFIFFVSHLDLHVYKCVNSCQIELIDNSFIIFLNAAASHIQPTFIFFKSNTFNESNEKSCMLKYFRELAETITQILY